MVELVVVAGALGAFLHLVLAVSIPLPVECFVRFPGLLHFVSNFIVFGSTCLEIVCCYLFPVGGFLVVSSFACFYRHVSWCC